MAAPTSSDTQAALLLCSSMLCIGSRSQVNPRSRMAVEAPAITAVFQQQKKRGKEIHLPCFKEILLEVSLDIFTCVSFVGACLHGHTQGRQIDDETVFSSALSHLE